MYEFRLQFHWCLFPMVQLTIFQHWLRKWLDNNQATSHYLNQWWLFYWRIYAPLGLNESSLSSWKTRTSSSYIENRMVVAGQVTAMMLTQFFWNIAVIAPEGLRYFCLPKKTRPYVPVFKWHRQSSYDSHSEFDEGTYGLYYNPWHAISSFINVIVIVALKTWNTWRSATT